MLIGYTCTVDTMLELEDWNGTIFNTTTIENSVGILYEGLGIKIHCWSNHTFVFLGPECQQSEIAVFGHVSVRVCDESRPVWKPASDDAAQCGVL